MKKCGPTVACTITAHHLALIVDDWAGQSWHFCKPVAKLPDDRRALQEIVKQGRDQTQAVYQITDNCTGHPRFFLGSDSAPHPPQAKSTSSPMHACAAGVYTSPILLPLVAHLLESFGALDNLESFVSKNGRSFYKRPAATDRIVKLRKVVNGTSIDRIYESGDHSVVPFWAGKLINWDIQ